MKSEQLESLLVVAIHFRSQGKEMTMQSLHRLMGCGYGTANRILARLKQTATEPSVTPTELFAHLVITGNFAEACRMATLCNLLASPLPDGFRRHMEILQPQAYAGPFRPK